MACFVSGAGAAAGTGGGGAFVTDLGFITVGAAVGAEWGAFAIGGGGGADVNVVVFTAAVRADFFGLLGVAATVERFADLRFLRRTFLVALRFEELRNLGTTRGLRGGETRSRDCGDWPPGINNEPPPKEGDIAPVRGMPIPPSFSTLRSTLTSDVLRS